MAEQFVWTSPDGVSLNLSDESAGYSVLANGTRGLRSVTYELTTSRHAGIDGATVDAIQAEANQPTLGLLMEADGVEQFRSRLRGLVRAMRPKSGPGTLTVTTEAGESRSLTCYCVGGLEGDEAADTTLDGSWWKVALKLFAPDPWWLGESQDVNFGLGAPSVFFPIFPLVLSPSSVQGAFSVDLSDSDSPAFPVWTIIGPGTSLTLTNVTTSRTLTVSAMLTAGQTMIIDTRPGHRSIRRDDGTNLLGSTTGEPQLWPLVETVNQITVNLTGATADSRIIGQYAPRYAGI